MPFSGCPPGNQTGRLIPTISNPAVAEGMLQNVPMVLDFAYKYVGSKNAFGFAKGLVKFANKVISVSNKAITNAGNGTREVSLPEEAVQPPVDTNSGVGYNGNSESDFLDQAAGMERVNRVEVTLNYQPTSGIKLTNNPDKTTTILGRYESDTKGIIEELGIPKSTDFSGNKGGFNLLNTPDEYYISADQFWIEYNKPFLDEAIDRGDDILMATPINNSTIYTKFGRLTGYGREYEYLRSKGYEFIDGKMVMKGAK